MTSLTAEETKLVEECRKRVEAATPGPWQHVLDHQTFGKRGNHLVWGSAGPGYGAIAECSNYFRPINDAAFIAASRTDIPSLLTIIDRLTAKVDEQSQEIERLRELDALRREVTKDMDRAGTASNKSLSGGCLLCAWGNDLPDGEWCRGCGMTKDIPHGRAMKESPLGQAVRLARGSNEPPTIPLKFSNERDAIRTATIEELVEAIIGRKPRNFNDMLPPLTNEQLRSRLEAALSPTSQAGEE